MKKQAAKKRVSKAQWLEIALDTLAKEGVQGIRIERLARDLGIAKSGFYWHFGNRRDLLQAMLDFWAAEYTNVVTNNVELQSMDPEKRLFHVMSIILEHDLAKYELAIRDWASNDSDAAKSVRKVYSFRLDYARSIFSELGFRGNQLEMRTRLFICYQTWERLMFDDVPKEELRRWLRLRHKLLVTK